MQSGTRTGERAHARSRTRAVTLRRRWAVPPVGVWSRSWESNPAAVLMGDGSARAAPGRWGDRRDLHPLAPGPQPGGALRCLRPQSARQDTILRPPRCERGALPLSYRRLGADPGARTRSTRGKGPVPVQSGAIGMVLAPGVEPGLSCVSGRRRTRLARRGWWTWQVPTLLPPPCRGGALPMSYTSMVMCRVVPTGIEPVTCWASLSRSSI